MIASKFAGFHVGSDVEVPLLQIAVGASVNRRRNERLYVAGQDDLLGRRGLLRRHN